MPEIRIKTDKELLIEFRNVIAFRVTERRANIRYFTERIKKLKHDSQEIVDARNSLADNQHRMKLDQVFVKTIDEMIKEEK